MAEENYSVDEPSHLVAEKKLLVAKFHRTVMGPIEGIRPILPMGVFFFFFFSYDNIFSRNKESATPWLKFRLLTSHRHTASLTLPLINPGQSYSP